MSRFGKLSGKLNIKKVMLTVLALIMVTICVTAMGINSNAKIDDKKNVYALVIQTGEDSGAGISLFAIEYEDKNGVIRRVYIDPDANYTETMKIANDAGFDKDSNDRIKIIESLGYRSDKWRVNTSNKLTALAKNSTNTIFFNSYTEIATIKSISVIPKIPISVDNDGWDCYGIDVYAVSEVNGLSLNGYVSNETTVLFTGKEIANVTYADNTSKALSFDFSDESTRTITPEGGTVDRNQTIAYLKNSGLNHDTDDENFMVKVDIADVYGAGLEEYMSDPGKKTKLSDLKMAEPLALMLVYRDVNGTVKTSTMPVLTSALTYAIESGNISLEDTLADYIAQGGSLVFPTKLPGFQELLSGNITYVDSEATLTNESGFVSVDSFKTNHNNHYKAMADNKDQLDISGVQLYKKDQIGITTINEKIQIIPDEKGAPDYYCVLNGIAGENVSLGTKVALKFAPRGNNANYTAYDSRIAGNKLFLMAIETGFEDITGTVSDIELTLNYFDISGQDQSKSVVLRNDCKSYYGYWKGDKNQDLAYEEGIREGHTLYVLVETPEEVDYFSGVELINNGNNNWGADSFSIYRIKDLSNIYYKWRDTDKQRTDVDHYRIVNGVDLLNEKLGDTSERLVYLQGNKEDTEGDDDMGKSGYIYVSAHGRTNLDFNSVKISKIQVHDPDFFKHAYKMDYEYATRNQGFAMVETQYEVIVHVGTDPYSNANRDDCGSNNFFYFQLVFESGTSAYVQANQQLESDGFRGGKAETFYISVNRDYGDVTAVNIIPETSEDLGQPYDKLMIDNIEVRRSFGNGFGESFNINKVGWIGIDSNDNKNGEHTQKELAKTYHINSRNTTADIMFALNNGSNLLTGKVSAQVRYVDAKGNTVTSEPFDVVRKMYSFDGKEDLMNKDDKGGATSRPELMFRPNTVDRFIWDSSGVDHLVGIDFYVTNTDSDPIDWVVNSVGASLIESGDIDNDRAVTKKGEYIIGNGQSIPIASSNSASIYKLHVEPNKTQKLSVEFTSTAGSSLAQTSRNTMPYIVSREPASQNDTVNVYAFLDPSAPEAAHKFDVTCEVVYNDVYGYPRVSVNKMKPGTAENIYGVNQRVYQVKALGAKQFGSLGMGYIQLSANGSADCSVPIEYVLVQRMRNNVMIDSYICYFTGGPANIATSGIPARTMSIAKIETEDEYQVVTLEFGDETDNVTALNPEKYDVAVALNYISTLGGDDTEYMTEYVYLTDMGITSIKPGDVVDVKFNKVGIKEVTGVTVASTSFLNAQITKASVGLYKSDGEKQVEGSAEVTKDFKVKGWYSFGGDKVNNGSAKLERTGSGQGQFNTVSPVTFTFKTKDHIDGYSSLGVSANDHIEMTINYLSNGNISQYTVNDITKNVVSGSFSEGDEAVVRILPVGINADTIQSVKLKPRCEDSGKYIYWGVESIKINFGDGQQTDDERFVTKDNLVFSEDGSDESNTVSFKGVRLRGYVFGSKSSTEYVKTDSSIAVASQANPANVQLSYQGQPVYIGVNMDITNSGAGYNVSVLESGIGETKVEQNGMSFVVKMTGSDGGDTTKKIKIASNENPDCYVILNIELKHAATPTEAPTATATPTEAPSPSSEPTATPTPAPAPEPTPTPVPEPTPTPEPTPEPNGEG